MPEVAVVYGPHLCWPGIGSSMPLPPFHLSARCTMQICSLLKVLKCWARLTLTIMLNMDPDSHQKSVLPFTIARVTYTRQITNLCSVKVLDCWARLALAIIPHMDPAAVKRSILPFAMARAAHRDMGTHGRLLCAALLGAAAAKLPKENIELECLPKALALCQVIILLSVHG